MSSNSSHLISALEALLVDNPTDLVLRGDKLLESLLALKESVIVRQLLGLFDDEPSHQDLMWSMLHGIESLPGQSYATELLVGMPQLWRSSQEWSETILLRALRDPETRAALRRQIGSASPPARGALRHVFSMIKDQHPDVSDLAADLLHLVAEDGTGT